MNKKELYVYKDKIRKLYKSAIAFKNASDDYNDFQDNILFTSDFDLNNDFNQLKLFMKNNPELRDMLEEVEGILSELSE